MPPSPGPIRVLTRAGRILRSPLPGEVKRAVLRSYLALAAKPGRRRNPTEPRNVAGYRVQAADPETLRFLFDETFVDLAYFFRARGEAPFIIDGGSNVGFSVLFFKRLYPAARILAFEPEPAAFRLLTRNLAANRITGVEVRAEALGGCEGETAFYVDPAKPASPLAGTVAGRTGGPPIRVRQVRLSTFVDREVDLVKLDLEGAERAVLEDLVDTGAARRIRRMIIEYHHHVDPWRDDLGDFLNLLTRGGFGYHVGAWYDPRGGGAEAPVYQDVQIHAYAR